MAQARMSHSYCLAALRALLLAQSDVSLRGFLLLSNLTCSLWLLDNYTCWHLLRVIVDAHVELEDVLDGRHDILSGGDAREIGGFRVENLVWALVSCHRCSALWHVGCVVLLD